MYKKKIIVNNNTTNKKIGGIIMKHCIINLTNTNDDLSSVENLNENDKLYLLYDKKTFIPMSLHDKLTKMSNNSIIEYYEIESYDDLLIRFGIILANTSKDDELLVSNVFPIPNSVRANQKITTLIPVENETSNNEFKEEKRSPCRPRKNLVEEDISAVKTEIKREPGRPKKNTSIENRNNTKMEAKRSPGRPRKNPIKETANVEKMVSKRGHGRPRKNQ